MKTLGKARVDKIEWNPFLFETPLFLNLSFPCLKPLWQLTYKPTCWTGEKVTVAFVKSTRHWENEFVPVWVLVCFKIPFAGPIQSRQGDHCGCDQHLSADVFTRRWNKKNVKLNKRCEDSMTEVGLGPGFDTKTWPGKLPATEPDLELIWQSKLRAKIRKSCKNNPQQETYIWGEGLGMGNKSSKRRKVSLKSAKI